VRERKGEWDDGHTVFREMQDAGPNARSSMEEEEEGAEAGIEEKQVGRPRKGERRDRG